MVLPKLRFIWIIILFVGGAIAFADIVVWHNAGLTLVGSVAAGFASSAFFSTPHQFFVRGAGHEVYLITQNIFGEFFFYELANRETLNSFGGIWHDTLHVSESMINFLSFLGSYGGKLDIEKADLYYLPSTDGKASYFAILQDTRYGISPIETVGRLWPNYKTKQKEISREDLNRFKPGRDLVAVDYWPQKDQMIKPQNGR